MSSIELRSSDLDQINVGQLRAVWSARGDRILRYSIDLRHNGLNLHRELSAPELFILEGKASALLANWEEKFASQKLKNLFRDGRAAADDATVQAQERLRSLSRLLAHTLSVDDVVDWDTLKDHSTYEKPASYPEPSPVYEPMASPVYVPPNIGFIDVIFGKKSMLISQAESAHDECYRAWEDDDRRRQQEHENNLADWEERKREFWQKHEKLQADFEKQQLERNQVVDQLAADVSRGDVTSVVEHANLVLESSDYGGLFEKSFTIQYDPDQRLLKVEYRIPNQDQLPNTKSVKFNKTTGELIGTRIPDREAKANFENAAYQIALRTIHELFEADIWGNIDKLLFNGVVEFIDPRTGRETRSCILSVLADSETFGQIDLARVEPKACFKSLKGVSAASLSSMTAIAPVLQLDRTDERFVEGYEVAADLDETQNLASMSWEDFEHLVRELFEKEFSSRGGEVKITQASRDGGVDAIAFDPDPITGGKIVIQAKRYTRAVGVSAVRDLFGTVMNEGASKGILVTTADYGPDAHQFAAGKPLTLLSGSHLLYMLQRHGYKAKIDLRQAREELLSR
jgi:restriction system protein